LIHVLLVVSSFLQVHSLDGDDRKNGAEDDEDKARWPGGAFVDALLSALRRVTF
jgi:hypothetical protein